MVVGATSSMMDEISISPWSDKHEKHLHNSISHSLTLRVSWEEKYIYTVAYYTAFCYTTT